MSKTSIHQLGMPVLIELKDINEQVAICKELGLQFIELHMNLPEYIPDNLDPKLVKNLSEKEKIDFTLHLPDELDLASFHKPILSGYLALCKKTILWAKKAGITLINAHLKKGVHFTLPDRKVLLYEKYPDHFVSTVYISFKILTDIAYKNNIKICVENANNFYLPFIGKAIEKISKLKGLYFTWDTGHDAMSGFREKAVLMKYKNKIKHIHLHDYAEKLDHQALYTGNAEINEALIFSETKKIAVLIETKTIKSLKESIVSLTSPKIN